MRHTLAFAIALTFVTRMAVAADWPGYRGPNTDGIAEAAPFDELALTPVWKTPIGDAFGQLSVVGNRVFLLAERGADEFCISLDASTGKEVWAKRIDKTITEGKNLNGPRSTPAVDGNYVYALGTYCSNGYKVGAGACRISRDGDKWTAAPLWSTPGQNMSIWSMPVYRDGYIYGLFDDGNGPLACLDIETGKVMWSESGFGSGGSLILVGDNLLVQTPTGDLVLVRASSDGFKELGRVHVLPSRDWTAPTLVNGMIYARNCSFNGSTAEITCLKLGE